MGNYNFKQDLKASEISENKVCDYLRSRGCENIHTNNNYKYDISFEKDGKTYLLEVKEDMQFQKTGNVAIELQSRGKASGICTSESHIWCYLLGEEMWFAKTPDIRLFLIQHWDRFRRVNGGDEGTSLVALVKLSDFKDIFKLGLKF